MSARSRASADRRNIASRRVQLHTASWSKEHSDKQSRSTPRNRAHRTAIPDRCYATNTFCMFADIIPPPAGVTRAPTLVRRAVHRLDYAVMRRSSSERMV